MGTIAELLTPLEMVLAALVVLGAGLIKGMVGFAMPMIMISGLSTLIAPELALAALILPTVMTNAQLALREGPKAALETIKRFGLFLAVGGVFLIASAQLVTVLPQRWLFLMIGGPITLFCLMQLLGWKPRIARTSRRIEAGVGAFAGAVGGVSGVWGPPTVAYLTAIDTPKGDQMRIQGVIYGLGAVALFGAHLQSGLLNRASLPLSVVALVPAFAGMWIGLRLHDRVDQRLFRRITLAVLLIAGLNLIRKGLLS